jgi:hypothetical protein
MRTLIHKLLRSTPYAPANMGDLPMYSVLEASGGSEGQRQLTGVAKEARKRILEPA